MGASHGEFTKYPRTPHLFGSKGTDDDKHLGEAESKRFIADESLIVEEKIDGTNVGIHFSDSGKMVLQCRGHLITEAVPEPVIRKLAEKCEPPTWIECHSLTMSD